MPQERSAGIQVSLWQTENHRTANQQQTLVGSRQCPPSAHPAYPSQLLCSLRSQAWSGRTPSHRQPVKPWQMSWQWPMLWQWHHKAIRIQYLLYYIQHVISCCSFKRYDRLKAGYVPVPWIVIRNDWSWVYNIHKDWTITMPRLA